MFQQNTSSLQLSTDTEKAIHKSMLSGIVLWITRLTTAPSHSMTAHVVRQLPHGEDFDKVGFFPFLEIKHIARNQPSQSVANYKSQRISEGPLTISLQTNQTMLS